MGDDAGLAGLLSGLTHPDSELRVADHPAVERAAYLLAAQLRTELGSDGLHDAEFRAIPRGGIFVLAMLAYFLDLGEANFRANSTAPWLVIVDDVAYSGARFAWFTREEERSNIAFAHLYSHPGLREAIRVNDRRVRHCLAAHDLDGDPPPAADEPESVTWFRHWRGRPRPVALPWSEPDWVFWNPTEERLDHGWRRTPPDRCLRNWSLLGMPAVALLERTYRLPEGVTYRLAEDEVLLVHLDTEQVFSLRSSAALMWRGLVAYGSVETASDAVAARFDIDRATAVADTHRFADDLTSAGLLERIEQSE